MPKTKRKPKRSSPFVVGVRVRINEHAPYNHGREGVIAKVPTGQTSWLGVILDDNEGRRTDWHEGYFDLIDDGTRC